MNGWHEDFEDETYPCEMHEGYEPTDEELEELNDEPDQFRDDVEADADALANAGWGTDENYGCYVGDDW